MAELENGVQTPLKTEELTCLMKLDELVDEIGQSKFNLQKIITDTDDKVIAIETSNKAEELKDIAEVLKEQNESNKKNLEKLSAKHSVLINVVETCRADVKCEHLLDDISFVFGLLK